MKVKLKIANARHEYDEEKNTYWYKLIKIIKYGYEKDFVNSFMSQRMAAIAVDEE